MQCSGEKEKKPTNVILITLDTHRADYVSAYNPEKSKTPNIDFFAQKGILCENCYTAAEKGDEGMPDGKYGQAFNMWRASPLALRAASITVSERVG